MDLDSELGAAAARVLAALEDLPRSAEDPSAEVVRDIARAALRRIPEADVPELDVPRLARQLAEGARLLDRRAGPVAVAVLSPYDKDPTASSVVLLASEDRPFLLSTVLHELERSGRRVRRHLHPIMGTDRDAGGRLVAVHAARTAEVRETLLHLELDRQVDESEVAHLTDRLTSLVTDVHAATDDFGSMVRVLRDHADRLRTAPPRDHDPDEVAEVADLIDWLLDDHMVLLGVRRYDLTELDHDGERTTALVTAGETGLGLLADSSSSRYIDPVPLEELPDELAHSLREPALLAWSRTRSRSTVQRRVRMEHLAFGRFDSTDRPLGVLRLLGLFTRKGESSPAATTPLLRRRLADVLESEDLVPGSHSEVALTSLFEALPKNELFSRDRDDVHRVLVALLHAEEHREIHTVLRVDRQIRTVSVLVAIPRDTYSPQLRDRLSAHLSRKFGADDIEVAESYGDRNDALARFLLSLEHDPPEVSPSELQREVRDLARSWVDEVTAHLAATEGETRAKQLVREVVRRLPRSYRDTVDATVAVGDIQLVDRVLREDLALGLAWRRDDAPDLLRLRALKRATPLELSSFLPILESLGLTVIDEVPHRLLGGDELHLHDFGVRLPERHDQPWEARAFDLHTEGERLAETILACWRGHAEVDGLNRLVLLTGVTWRDVTLLRTYRRYRRQLGTAYTPAYVEEALVRNVAATAALVELIHARFDPAIEPVGVVGPTRRGAEEQAQQRFASAMVAVTRLDHDRILRGLKALVDATVRTNAFRADAMADGSGEPYVAIKVDPSGIENVPAPVPYREVFVRSPRMEGVHLRAGAVARGGVRWSDRQDDVRTEVLDLVKAQVLKNALIVPTGAKGGFVLLREPDDPENLRDEVRRQYVTYVRALLDVTDDLDLRGAASGSGDTVVPPADVVRHDGDDPYLVVAADRGTARFSDTANAIAARYGFWLGDAFASGGSQGYDHKVLGVTARGAWRAIERHFRELGVDVATESITVAGIGDMSGDVFANGLLCSQAVKLVAAFDHRHVFIDPDPDPAASFAERQRLAALPRSSWDDYDRAVLSDGGLIASRDIPSVTVSQKVRDLLRIDVDELSPPDLIRAVLTAPVDLLFAAGIGTFVKASTERHADAGDRANDEVRVDASEVRARVLGEGANLALTQRARIELARRGARVDQDAIHNAAGVATSDAEVNLKILLELAIAEGRLDPGDRDALLADLADDVVDLVLDAVDRQVAALSAEIAREESILGAFETFIARLESRGDLDRDVEVLPSTEELQQRAQAGAGMTRPELATLLAWAKREVKEALLASDAPEDPVLADAVRDLFPQRVIARFGDLLARHRLRHELVATAVANDVVNRMGIPFVSGLAAEIGTDIPNVVRAYRAARKIIDAPRWWAAIDALEAEEMHPPERVRELAEQLHRLVADITAALLVDPLGMEPQTVVERDQPVARVLLDQASQLGTAAQRRARQAYAQWLIDDLIDPDLARFLACARDLATVPDVAVVTAIVPDRGAAEVADVALRLGEQLGVDRVEAHLQRAELGEGWSRRQQRGLARDLRRLRRVAAISAFLARPDVPAEKVAEGFLDDRHAAVRRALAMVRDAERTEGTVLDAVAVAARSIREAIDPIQR